MAISDVFKFENPEVVAGAIGLLIFVMLFTALKGKLDRGAALLVSLVMGFLAGYYLYMQGIDSLGNTTIAILASLLVLVVIGKIMFGFGKNSQRQFGN